MRSHLAAAINVVEGPEINSTAYERTRANDDTPGIQTLEHPMRDECYYNDASGCDRAKRNSVDASFRRVRSKVWRGGLV